MPTGPRSTSRRARLAERKAERLSEQRDRAPERVAMGASPQYTRWFEVTTHNPSAPLEANNIFVHDLRWDFAVDEFDMDRFVVDEDSHFVAWDTLHRYYYKGITDNQWFVRFTDQFPSPHNQGTRGYATWITLTKRWEIQWMQPSAIVIGGVMSNLLGVDEMNTLRVISPIGAILTIVDPAGSASVANLINAGLGDNVLGMYNSVTDFWDLFAGDGTP